ncbi:prolactin receptor a [Poecilia reticulata]|uniref:Prolactin receptor n=1 Tax=Poecilia reticulata TaxID=8081 RepID=A0A3P9PVS5_POERE|nr:PREDICTED: prolactin receptor [Poecilia reticulata]
MKKAGEVVLLWLLILFIQIAAGEGYSPPGKPTNISCRSPEKETFTCWWKPGSDGGLPTTYALYYRKEGSQRVFECPDYKTAGKNSCFFSKNVTFVWVNYNITVVATNSRGRTFSDPVDIDVVYIVKPNPPEEVVVNVTEDKDWPFLQVSWKPPKMADTRSGWITLIYEVRLKLENKNKWEELSAGQRKTLQIYSLRSGGTYDVQVRCKPDHGFWSEWSPSSRVKVPEYLPQERSMWILIVVFAAFILVIFIWMIYMNFHSVKRYLLPPVPGPKIKGIDKQLLKSGKSEDIFSSLVVSDFPPTTSNYEDFLVEYLEVYVPEQRELIMDEGKDLQDDSFKTENSTCDNDSGRGSCDSHTLLTDKGGGDKEDGQQSDPEGSQAEVDTKSQEEALEEELLACSHENVQSPNISNEEKVKSWPLFSPLPQYSLSPVNRPNPPKTGKQHCLSDSLFTPNSLSSYFTQPGPSTTKGFRSNYWECSFDHKQSHPLHPQSAAHEHLQAQNDLNTPHVDYMGVPLDVHVLNVRPSEYVEVQRVSDEDGVLLHPVSPSQESSRTVSHQTEDYSRVRMVNNDNGLLLLQRDAIEEEKSMCPYQEDVVSRASITPTLQNSATGINTALPILDESAASGYVDTATMFGLPTY